MESEMEVSNKEIKEGEGENEKKIIRMSDEKEESTAMTTNSNSNDDGNTGCTSKRKHEEEKEALTKDGEMPQKKFYRARAHCNPLAHNDTFDYPYHPKHMEWSSSDYYPNHPPTTITTTSTSTSTTTTQQPTMKVAPNVLDIGCGFGGLTVALSTLLPKHTILGMEIRAKVTEYVRLRIMALRKQHPGKYQNVSVMRSNSMKFMPNYFEKESIEKLFFCFPDPHFKRKNHPRRIISTNLLSEYAYFLKPNIGRLYCITDVEELHQWHVSKCRAHPLYRELTKEECDSDPCVQAMYNETEEGKKVERAGSNKYYAVYQRLPNTTTNTHTENDDDVSVNNFWDSNQFGVSSIVQDDNNNIPSKD